MVYDSQLLASFARFGQTSWIFQLVSAGEDLRFAICVSSSVVLQQQQRRRRVHLNRLHVASHPLFTGAAYQYSDAAKVESIEPGRSELADGAPAAAAESSNHDQDPSVVWEKLKESYPSFFRDLGRIVELGRVVGQEDRHVHIYEASINGRGQLMALVFDKEDFSVADIDRQFPLRTELSEPRPKWDGFVLGSFDFRHIVRYSGRIDFGTFLKDGRFAFVMPRCQKELELEWAYERLWRSITKKLELEVESAVVVILHEKVRRCRSFCSIETKLAKLSQVCGNRSSAVNC